MKRLGRPLKEIMDGKRAMISFRITADTKRKLVAATKRNGRSISQECELRLEKSFWAEAKNESD